MVLIPCRADQEWLAVLLTITLNNYFFVHELIKKKIFPKQKGDTVIEKYLLNRSLNKHDT